MKSSKIIGLVVAIAVVIGAIVYAMSGKNTAVAPQAADVSGTGVTTVPAPVNVRTLVKSQNTIVMVWDAPANASSIVSYKAEFGGYGTGYTPAYHNSRIIPATGELALQIGMASSDEEGNGLIANNAALKIASVDASGNMSSWVFHSDKLNTTADTIRPTVPGVAVASNITTTSAKFSWTPSTDNLGAVKYVVEATEGKTVMKLCESRWNTPSCEATGLVPGKKYTVKVKAMDADGTSYYKLFMDFPSKSAPWTIGKASTFTTLK